MDIKTDPTRQCLVCEQTNLEPLTFCYSEFFPKRFHRIAICKDCGHIQQFPLLTPHEYEHINNRFFGNMFMVGNQLNTAGNNTKVQKLDDRISGHIQKGYNILDVGAGEAWAMDYFKGKGCNYFAIEFVPRLADSIRERGGTVIGKTVFDDYSEHESRFEIIIFRHIIEHLLNPKEALTMLKKILSKNGIIYLALPNAQSPVLNLGFRNINKKGFRTSFIRPIHISYFCEGNVHRLAHSVGLTPLVSESSGEIYCLLKHADNNRFKYRNYYLQQRSAFRSAAKKTFITDWIQITRNLLKTIVKKTFKLRKGNS